MNLKQLIIKPYAEIEYRKYASGMKESKLKVRSLDETIDMLLNTDKSLVRFGDGEIRLMEGDSLPLQQGSAEIAEALKRVITQKNDGLEIGIPDIFQSLDMYRNKSKAFWKEHLVFYRKKYESVFDADREYYDAFFSRLHYMYADWDLSTARFERIRQIWAGRDVLVIESKSAHTGVDNDLLGLCKSVKRIIGPEKNTFSVIDSIKSHVLEYPKNILILISAGPAAKPLAADLVLAGYRVIDIGSLDMEYQWYQMGVCEKCHPEKKNYLTIEQDLAAGYEEYVNQIDYVEYEQR